MNTENAGTTFKDSFSEEIWKTTYKDHKDTDVNSTFRRVAKSIASAEDTDELKAKWEEKFYDLLTDFKAVSGGRITSNAGTDWDGTTFMNCFVGGLPEYNIDSIEGIYKVLQDQAKTLKSEGGWGMDFSWIRPRGSFIAGIGVESPGAVRFMELFDKSSEIVTAGSGKKKNNQKAKEKIRKGAQMATMACFSGTTWIDTIEGKVQIKDLVGKNPYLYCTDGNGNVFVRQALAVFSNGTRKTIKLHFDNGEYVECTPEHEFMLTDGSYVQAQNLKFNDSLAAINLRLQNDYLFVGVAGSRKQIAVHNAVYEMKYGSYPTSLGVGMTRTGDMTIAHHIDHNTINNHPDNILSMTVADHSRHHNSENLDLHRERIAVERKGKTWDEYYGEEKAAEIRVKRSNTTNGKSPWNKGLSGDDYKQFYKEGFSNQFIENTNHKVLKITESIEQEVFDISMPDYHNFCANGVFVHNCWHPDIIEFITAKQSGNKLSKFNMSVNCTADFMDKVNAIANGDESQDTWELVFPDTSDENYKKGWKGSISDWKKQGGKVVVHNTVKVSWLWNLIMESTYNRNEPGVLFLDRANERSPSNYLETILSTNP